MGRSLLVLKHAMPMMLAQVIPLGASFVVVAVALALGRNDFVTVIGAVATVTSLGTLINVGVGVATLRDLARAQNSTRQITITVAKNLRLASAVSFMVFAVSITTAFGLWLASPTESVAPLGILVAFALQLPSYLLAPHTSVLTATFQHLDRERENLGITLTRTIIGLTIGLIVVIFVRDPIWAISFQSLTTSMMAVMILIERWRRLARSEIRLRLFPSPDFSPKEIWDRVLNSLDGAVFMILFMVAQLIAVSISVEIAAQVAAAVSFCRMIILPLKMIGITAGRMSLRDTRGSVSFVHASFRATGAFVVPIAMALILTATLNISPFNNGTLNILVAMQLLLEPFSGSLFSYLKVSFGAKSGLLGLVLTYLVLAPVLLILCRYIAPTAEALWSCLLLVRLCFSISTVLALLRGSRNKALLAR